jgi:hypothetical protein
MNEEQLQMAKLAAYQQGFQKVAIGGILSKLTAGLADAGKGVAGAARGAGEDATSALRKYWTALSGQTVRSRGGAHQSLADELAALDKRRPRNTVEQVNRLTSARRKEVLDAQAAHAGKRVYKGMEVDDALKLLQAAQQRQQIALGSTGAGAAGVGGGGLAALLANAGGGEEA